MLKSMLFYMYYKLLFKKRRQTTFFGCKEALFLLTRAPALLNSLSAGTDVAHNPHILKIQPLSLLSFEHAYSLEEV